MAVPEPNHSNAPRIDCALPLLDFDWKLKDEGEKVTCYHGMVKHTDCSEGKAIGGTSFLSILLLFQYAVASGTIASVNKPLLRLELYVSKAPSKEKAGLGRVLPENQMQTSIAELTRAQLHTLIGAMGAIEQALEGAENATYS